MSNVQPRDVAAHGLTEGLLWLFQMSIDQTEFQRKFSVLIHSWVVNLVGGIAFSGFSVMVATVISSETLAGYKENFKGQSTLQIGLALLMFGYYLGLSFKEKSALAEFLTGFLSGSLVLGFYYSGIGNGIQPLIIFGFVCAIIAGVYFGGNKPLFNRKNLDTLIKILVSGFGWTFQAGTTLVSISGTLNLDPSIPIAIVVIIAAVSLMIWQRTNIAKLADSNDSSRNNVRPVTNVG